MGLVDDIAANIYPMAKRVAGSLEGSANRPYDDETGKRLRAPLGNVSLGIGRDLDSKPLKPEEIDFLFRNDFRDAVVDARDVLGDALISGLSQSRQLFFILLAFQLGAYGLLGFRKLLKAARAGDWSEVEAELWDSDLARKQPNRAKVLANLLKG